MTVSSITATHMVQVKRISPDRPGGAGGSALTYGSAVPDHNDLDLFNRAMQEAMPRSALKSQALAFVTPLGQLSEYMRRHTQMIARQMAQVQVTRDPATMLKVTAEMIDHGVESDLISKVIGKTVSTVDQLTKLS